MKDVRRTHGDRKQSALHKERESVEICINNFDFTNSLASISLIDLERYVNSDMLEGQFRHFPIVHVKWILSHPSMALRR